MNRVKLTIDMYLVRLIYSNRVGLKRFLVVVVVEDSVVMMVAVVWTVLLWLLDILYNDF